MGKEKRALFWHACSDSYSSIGNSGDSIAILSADSLFALFSTPFSKNLTVSVPQGPLIES